MGTAWHLCLHPGRRQHPGAQLGATCMAALRWPLPHEAVPDPSFTSGDLGDTLPLGMSPCQEHLLAPCRQHQHTACGSSVAQCPAHGTWHSTMHGIRHVAQGTQNMSHGTWHMTNGTWHREHDKAPSVWHMTMHVTQNRHTEHATLHATWHIACGTWNRHVGHGTQRMTCSTWCMACGTQHAACHGTHSTWDVTRYMSQGTWTRCVTLGVWHRTPAHGTHVAHGTPLGTHGARCVAHVIQHRAHSTGHTARGSGRVPGSRARSAAASLRSAPCPGFGAAAQRGEHPLGHIKAAAARGLPARCRPRTPGMRGLRLPSALVTRWGSTVPP